MTSGQAGDTLIFTIQLSTSRHGTSDNFNVVQANYHSVIRAEESWIPTDNVISPGGGV
jgi:hypothetical protein